MVNAIYDNRRMPKMYRFIFIAFYSNRYRICSKHYNSQYNTV